MANTILNKKLLVSLLLRIFIFHPECRGSFGGKRSAGEWSKFLSEPVQTCPNLSNLVFRHRGPSSPRAPRPDLQWHWHWWRQSQFWWVGVDLQEIRFRARLPRSHFKEVKYRPTLREERSTTQLPLHILSRPSEPKRSWWICHLQSHFGPASEEWDWKVLTWFTLGNFRWFDVLFALTGVPTQWHLDCVLPWAKDQR